MLTRYFAAGKECAFGSPPQDVSVNVGIVYVLEVPDGEANEA